ncbi:MAG: hypothetical protein AAFY65_02535 [Pseudomonadota bacterium]
MATSPDTDATVRPRAGMPLARAQRISARADTTRSTRSRPLIGLALVGAGAVTAILFAADPAPDQPAMAGSAPVASAPAAAPPSEEGVPTQVVETAAVPARPRTRALVVPCVYDIEQSFEALHLLAAQSPDWDIRRDGIATLMQHAVDCGAASLNVTGSLELAMTDIADLRIRWDRKAARLDLAVIDGTDITAEMAVFSDDGRPIELVLR